MGEGTAINALSGGVDSSVVTLLGAKALGDRLKTYFVENGIMREGEADRIVALFKEMAAVCGAADSWALYAMPTPPLVHGRHSAE